MHRYGLLLIAILTAAAPAAGQVERLGQETIPPGVAEGAIEFLNDRNTILFLDQARVPAGGRLVGDVGVLGGSIVISGEIDGSLVVVNGDAVFEPNGHVTGDLIVFGGEIEGRSDTSIGGSISTYIQTISYSVRDGRVVGRAAVDFENFEPSIPAGSSSLTLRVGSNYNRVEGLPIVFGPVVGTGGDRPLILEAFGILRTARGLNFDAENMGYRVRLEKSLTREPVLSIGATLRSEFVPIEDWGVNDLESSLSTFLLHRDYRDYDERQGWSAFLRYQRPSMDFMIEYRDEDHSVVDVISPWTIKDNDGPWRPQPLVETGNLQSIGSAFELDLRNDSRNPSDGWYFMARTRWSLTGGLTRQPYTDQEDPQVSVTQESSDATFATAFLDVRRYNRTSPTSSLNFRAVLAGSVTGDPVPSQFQSTLGGEGSLPGYELFQGDCGARSIRVQRGAELVDDAMLYHPRYGCDRIALVQVEFRSKQFFGWELDPASEWGNGWDVMPNVDLTPSWAFFVNAGRGWTLFNEGDTTRPFNDTEMLIDAGFGLILGRLGLYLAAPLKGDGQGVNFFVRLDRRF